MSRPTRGLSCCLPIRGYHPLWPDFPNGSGLNITVTGLVRVRSPLLTESHLISFPIGTEMFQFPTFASASLCIQLQIPLRVGFPIRTCSDQRMLPSPRAFSQGATSFIASCRQGIHQVPLLHLRTRILRRRVKASKY